jgi:hypothetical protein
MRNNGIGPVPRQPPLELGIKVMDGQYAFVCPGEYHMACGLLKVLQEFVESKSPVKAGMIQVPPEPVLLKE